MRQTISALPFLLTALACGTGEPRAADPGDSRGSSTPSAATEPEVCEAGQLWSESFGACLSRCAAPHAPRLPVLPVGTRLTFTAVSGAPIEVGANTDANALEPAFWQSGPDLVLDCTPPCSLRVFARGSDPACPEAPRFEAVYAVEAGLPPAAGSPGSDAVSKDDPRLLQFPSGWVEPVEFGTDIDDTKWMDPVRALGAPTGEPMDVLVLGNGGRLVLTFESPFSAGPGPELAVFENAFNDTFLELGLVEVSSDGRHFARFDALSLGTAPTASTVDPTTIAGLAGKYRAGFATAFDLDLLTQHPLVQSGWVDLAAVRFVRLVDVVGDGTVADSFGHPIYDPTPTVGSGGFDLDAVAVLGSTPE